MLLHLLHLLLDAGVEFALESQRLHVIHVAIAVEQVSLKGRAKLLLMIASSFCLHLVVAIAVVPAAAVRLPRTQANPTEVCLAILILAYHVIAAAVLLDGDVALGALLGVGGNPVGRLRVVVAFFYPLAQQVTFHRVVPILAAVEAKRVTALTGDRTGLHVLHLYRVVAVGRGTPPQQPVALLIKKIIVINFTYYFHILFSYKYE